MIKFATKHTKRKVFSMNKSIQHFEEIGINKLEKVVENFLKDPRDMAGFVYGIQNEVIQLGLDIIKETLEDCDQMLRDSAKRKSRWVISRRDNKQLITSLGGNKLSQDVVQEQGRRTQRISPGYYPGDGSA